MRTIDGDVITENSSQHLSFRDYFLAAFPFSQLRRLVSLTDENLLTKQKPLTSLSEIMKFIGIIILVTRFEFGERADLLSSTSSSKYIPATSFGSTTGMSRSRFDYLRRNLSFSNVHNSNDHAVSSSEVRWALFQISLMP